MTGTWSYSTPLRRGLGVLVIGVAGFVVWSFATEINGAVVASGQIAVEARLQAIQHPDGGLVRELHVRDGSTVRAGQKLLSLDGTELQAQRTVTQRALAELIARIDRLSAEILGSRTIAYRADLPEGLSASTDVSAIRAAETALFEARRYTLQKTLAQIAERQVQTTAMIAGRERQLEAAHRQLELVSDDLATQESLFERGLIENMRLSALRREEARLAGDIGELEASLAEARSAIAGFEVEGLRLEAVFREAAQAELRELQPSELELREQLSLVETRIGRLDLRAPMAGTVLGLQIHTIGGVVPSGAEIASIVPMDVPLIFTVEIDPTQIDQIYTGQEAMIRFPNFNATLTPEVEGRVTTVSADAVRDPANDRRFFVAELALVEGADVALGDNVLQPGMPVEAFISTDPRTPASFLLKPLADYWVYAMREE